MDMRAEIGNVFLETFKEYMEAVEKWAEDNGYEVSDTPETVFEQYKEVFMEQVQEYVESFKLEL
jgi:hypothetical protein